MAKLSLKSEFSKNVATLVTGTAFAQFITVAVSPLLSRIYSPEEFGILGAYMAIASALAVFMSARYELAILLPEKEEDAVALVFLCIAINFIVSFIVFIASLLFIFFVVPHVNIIAIRIKWLYLLAPLIFFIGIYQIFSSWANRKKQYHTIAYYRISNSVVTASANTFFGLAGFNAAGLFIGTLGGNIASSIIYIYLFFRDILPFKTIVSKKELKEVAIRYEHFPKINSIQTLSDVFQINGIIYFLSYFFNTTVVGSFSYAIRILQAPMNLIGGSIAQVFYQHASVLQNEGKDVQPLLSSTIKKSSLIALPVLIILMLLGPEIFSFIFGSNWRIAGEYARILSPWIFFDFIRASISQYVFIAEQQKRLLFFSIFSNIILIISMIFGGVLENERIAFFIFSLLNSILTAYIIYWIYSLSLKTKT